MTDWPATLPQAFLLADGIQKMFPDNRLRSQNDVGPSKVRRRSSLDIGHLSGRMLMSATQFAALEAFVETTTASGTLPFNFPDPWGGADLEVRFGDSLPRLVEFRGKHHIVELVLEVLP